MGLWEAVSGISWTICKQSAPRFRQITTPTPHHSIFTGRMLFLTPDEQCQSTEGKVLNLRRIKVKSASTVRKYLLNRGLIFAG